MPRAPARNTARRPPPRRRFLKACASARSGSSPATADAAASAQASESRWPAKASPSRGSWSTSRRRRARTASVTLPGQTKEQMEDPATVRALLARHIDVDKIEVLRRLVYGTAWRLGVSGRNRCLRERIVGGLESLSEARAERAI